VSAIRRTAAEGVKREVVVGAVDGAGLTGAAVGDVRGDALSAAEVTGGVADVEAADGPGAVTDPGEADGATPSQAARAAPTSMAPANWTAPAAPLRSRPRDHEFMASPP
jgi:hypothetical protein